MESREVKHMLRGLRYIDDRHHTDDENLCQMIYQILAGYFNDNDADELINEPILNAILQKDALGKRKTQPTF